MSKLALNSFGLDALGKHFYCSFGARVLWELSLHSVDSTWGDALPCSSNAGWSGVSLASWAADKVIYQNRDPKRYCYAPPQSFPRGKHGFGCSQNNTCYLSYSKTQPDQIFDMIWKSTETSDNQLLPNDTMNNQTRQLSQYTASSSAATTLLQTTAPRLDQRQLYETGSLQARVNSVNLTLTSDHEFTDYRQ
eukprot:6326611-Amphidinium_carterae.1